MDQTSQELLLILRCFTTGKKVSFAITDVQKLLSLATAHNITGICAYTLLQGQSISDPDVVSVVRRICKDTIKSFTLRYSQTLEMLDLLNENGVDHIIIKGLVVREYYPIPELRTYGDIDIVIRPEDRPKTHELMLQNGFTVKADWEPVFSYYRQAEFYELHTRLMEVDISEHADYQSYFANCWENSYLIHGHTYQLNPEFHLLYLLTHLAKHIYGSGAGLRMYLDIAFFVDHFKEQLDWKWIVRELDKLRMQKFANTVFSFIEKHLGIVSLFPLTTIDETVMEDFIEYTIRGGLFGKSDSNHGIQSVKNDDRSSMKVSRGKAFLHRLFPKASALEQRYTYLEKRPWLLPVAWVHRLVRTRADWKKHQQEAKDIISADTEEVKRLRNIYQSLGFGN